MQYAVYSIKKCNGTSHATRHSSGSHAVGLTLGEGRDGEQAGIWRLGGQRQAGEGVHDEVHPQHLQGERQGMREKGSEKGSESGRCGRQGRAEGRGRSRHAGAACSRLAGRQAGADSRRTCTAVSGDSAATIAPVTAVATATRLMVS